MRDLLDARDAYHLHLSHLENVVGTAIGRFLIRREEPNAVRPEANAPYGKVPEPRTLYNTEVKSWSWPSVLVFVDRWTDVKDLAHRPDQAVPRALYLPDGRVVPTCVVLAPRDSSKRPPLERLNFASGLLGGGYPVLTVDQGTEQIGSTACLVTNGTNTFVLTCEHVAGDPGRPVYTLVGGARQRIGASESRQLGKMEFTKVYPGWPGTRAYVNIDAGLIRVDDVNDWTAQVYGIGEVGEIADLHPSNVSLDLIGCPVRAFGGVSGVLEGQIQALMYRYRSVGGVDYVADLLIGPRGDGRPVRTQPGDSGTLWFYDPGAKSDEMAKARPDEKAKAKPPAGGKGEVRKSRDPARTLATATPAPESGKADVSGRLHLVPEHGKRAPRLRPIAMQWGGERLGGDMSGLPVQFALATFLSTICRQLDVDLVRDWNVGHSEYWGKIGHFKIGAKACELLTTAKLSTLMMENRTNIGFDDEDLRKGSQFRVGRDQFVPLADVPDYVWIAAARTRNPRGRKNEGMQHFADMDQKAEAGEFEGKTLLDLCEDSANISAKVWKAFYDSFPDDERPEEGVLPFRVWQLYDKMVEALRNQKVLEFVCAGGTMAHYVGDACQPLHVSHMHHGRGPKGGKRSPEWADFKKSPEYKIHALYEQRMFEVRPVEMLDLINEELDGVSPAKDVRGGYDAAVKVVDLMRSSHALLPPETIIDADETSETAPERARILFDATGKKTAKVIAAGCELLARLWESAWAQGKGNQIANGELGRLDEDEINRLVRNRSFLPALSLEEFVDEGFVPE